METALKRKHSFGGKAICQKSKNTAKRSEDEARLLLSSVALEYASDWRSFQRSDVVKSEGGYWRFYKQVS